MPQIPPQEMIMKIGLQALEIDALKREIMGLRVELEKVKPEAGKDKKTPAAKK
ncbi:MAG: hypothetical protein JEZ12_23600 [Desulfobacterium sp.]|nr:hypothetical protein [Desulfobacterium sp.]